MKTTVIAIILAIVMIGGAFWLVQIKNTQSTVDNENNVQIVDGVQIIDITAKGGYQPRQSVAKAGIPTVLKFNTKGTFDCSSAVRIPSLDISKNLPSSGVTEINLDTPSVGVLAGSCGMGMYPFEIDFR